MPWIFVDFVLRGGRVIGIFQRSLAYIRIQNALLKLIRYYYISVTETHSYEQITFYLGMPKYFCKKKKNVTPIYFPSPSKYATGQGLNIRMWEMVNSPAKLSVFFSNCPYVKCNKKNFKKN